MIQILLVTIIHIIKITLCENVATGTSRRFRWNDATGARNLMLFSFQITNLHDFGTDEKLRP